MSLRIHYAVLRDTLAVLKTSDFTRKNARYTGSGFATTPLGADFPNGQLGGHVTVHTGSFEVGVKSGFLEIDEPPIGMFINDAAGSPFENTPAVGSGKSPFVSGNGSVVEVDIFETANSIAALGIPYTAGALLYGSDNGLATTQPGGFILGTVYRAPGTPGLLGIHIDIRIA